MELTRDHLSDSRAFFVFLVCLFLYKCPDDFRGYYVTRMHLVERLMCVRWSFLGGVVFKEGTTIFFNVVSHDHSPYCQIVDLESYISLLSDLLDF